MDLTEVVEPAPPDETSTKETEESNSSINGFNLSSNDATVIETGTTSTTTTTAPVPATLTMTTTECTKNSSCEGSDSGVEVAESIDCRAHSTNSQDLDVVASPAPSCDSSIISCCSAYDEAYNLLVRRNSTLLDDYKLRNVDGCSENGSESSSVASTKVSKRTLAGTTKKKVILENKRLTNAAQTSSRSRSKPPVTTPKSASSTLRSKSTERTSLKTPKIPAKSLRLSKTSETPNIKKDVRKTLPRTPSANRTPATTPTEDGRWPSSYSRPAPLMTRSLRGLLPLETKARTQPSPAEVKSTIEKYATLPRRRKERSADNITDLQKGRDGSASRLGYVRKQLPAKSLPPYPKKKNATRIKIYHEISSQTALNQVDIEKALAGIHFNPKNPQDVEKRAVEVQVDTQTEVIEKLRGQLKDTLEKYEQLKNEHAEQTKRLKDVEEKLEEETKEKEGLKEELKNNNERIVAILTGIGEEDQGETASDDSLMALEARFKNVGQMVIKQEEEISKLNNYCRVMQRDFDKNLMNQRLLMQQCHDMESESKELQEFMQLEKSTLTDALNESQTDLQQHREKFQKVDEELKRVKEELRQTHRSSDQRREDLMHLQARYNNLEGKCRELLVHQGSTASGAAVALSSLVSRLEHLIDELVNSYNISEQELDDVIFHNEAYSNSSSSPDATPDRCKKFVPDHSASPKRGSSFISAVINAIKNATTHSSFMTNRENSRDNVTDNSDSTELLDSETEPCLMMEHVLEDVIVPDGHSVNMISSGNGLMTSLHLTHSESLNGLSHIRYQHNITESSATGDSVTLVDQVIDVDNLVTRLLKVIRIIQMENEEFVAELQDERDNYAVQVTAQKDTNKKVVKQLMDWETLGAKYKGEVKELMARLQKRTEELDGVKNELYLQHKEVEKLNQDVCELSTALSKTELEMKIREDEAAESLNKWESNDEIPSAEILGRLLILQKEAPLMKNKLEENQKQLNELSQEYVASKQVLSESLKLFVDESRRQYNAIDVALETLQSIETLVKQSPQLMKLQQELEEANFQSVSGKALAINTIA